MRTGRSFDLASLGPIAVAIRSRFRSTSTRSSEVLEGLNSSVRKNSRGSTASVKVIRDRNWSLTSGQFHRSRLSAHASQISFTHGVFGYIFYDKGFNAL